MPPKDPVPVIKDDDDDSYTKDKVTGDQGNTAKSSNPTYGVGGTAKDGGKSTEATVMDGGQDEPEKDETYKPS